MPAEPYMKAILVFLLIALFTSLTAMNAPATPPFDLSAADRQFLRDHAATRGFTLGQPVQAVPAPDGASVLFLRSQARNPELELYEFHVASG
jgi:hypothetical protein